MLGASHGQRKLAVMVCGVTELDTTEMTYHAHTHTHQINLVRKQTLTYKSKEPTGLLQKKSESRNEIRKLFYHN